MSSSGSHPLGSPCSGEVLVSGDEVVVDEVVVDEAVIDDGAVDEALEVVVLGGAGWVVVVAAGEVLSVVVLLEADRAVVGSAVCAVDDGSSPGAASSCPVQALSEHAARRLARAMVLRVDVIMVLPLPVVATGRRVLWSGTSQGPDRLGAVLTPPGVACGPSAEDALCMGAGTIAEAEVRRALRECLAADLPRDEGGGPPPSSGPPLVLAAVSGGADSLALAAALAREAGPAGARAGAVIVDHQLQAGSADVAANAARQCTALGLDPVEVVRAEVVGSDAGPEAAAREARYAALDEAADRHGAVLVLLGHTLDDQAEQVLLGLARGAGGRSLAGMPRRRERYVRPFLDLPRRSTHQACSAFGLAPWQDPHNIDPRFARVRARRALVDLEADLGPGLARALARTADHLRSDADLLDELTLRALDEIEVAEHDGGLDVAVADLEPLHRSIRARVFRRLLERCGAPRGRIMSVHVRECDRLVTDWRGQGPVHVPGEVEVSRSGGRVSVVPRSRVR